MYLPAHLKYHYASFTGDNKVSRSTELKSYRFLTPVTYNSITWHPYMNFT